MASNTKLGFALILLIMGAFIFVVYKKAHDPKFQQSVAGESESGGESKTFGDGRDAFGTGDDSVPPPAAIANQSEQHVPHHDAAHHDGKTAAQKDMWTADTDPAKPKTLEPSDQTAFNVPEPKRIPRTDLRETVKESPAFGDELVAQNEPEPFDSDAPRARKQTTSNTGDPFTGNTPRQKPANVTSRKGEPVPFDSKQRTADGDSFGSAETFDGDQSQKQPAKRAAANDDSADPFPDDKPASKGAKEEAPFGSDLDEPPRQTVPRRHEAETVEREHPTSEQKDGFESNTNSFTNDADPSQRPPAPIKPRTVDDWRNKDESHVHQPQPIRRDEFNSESRPVPHHATKQDNFADDANSTFDDARPSQPRKFSRDGEFADSPRRDIHPDLAGEETYVVQAKDNFWSISRKKYGTARYFQLLAELNKDVAPDPQQLQPGMKIVTPSQQFLEAHHSEIVAGRTTARLVSAEGNDTRDGHAAQGEFFVDEDGQPRYRVGAHETLSEVAQRHLGRAARWIQIFELNRDKLSSPNDLQVGTELVLPADARGGQLVRAVHESR